MNANFKLSIITPSYNQGQFIERTIQSVLGQDFKNLEYIVMDGGSTDNTVSILKKYQDALTWTSEKDHGQTHAVNKGLSKSHGEIIGWLNSDDIYYPDAFRSVVEYFDAHPEVDLAYGHANHIDPNDAILEPYYTEAWDFEKFKSVCFLCQPAVFFRRGVVHRFGQLDESLNYCMDYEYWTRLALGGARFSFIPKLLAGSRLYPENKTLGSAIAVHAEINSMLKKHLGGAPDRWLSNYGHVVLRKKGIEDNSPLFPAYLAAVTGYAAIRWNHSITPEMKANLKSWLKTTGKSLAHKVIRR